MHATRIHQFVKGGVDYTVTERFSPPQLANIMPSGEACELCPRAANIDIPPPYRLKIIANKPTPSTCHLNIDVDFSRNDRVVRDLRVLGWASGFAALFGCRFASPADQQETAAALEAGRQEALDAGEPPSPPTSRLGDFFRVAGDAMGLGCDYLMAGLWGVAAGVRRLLGCA